MGSSVWPQSGTEEEEGPFAIAEERKPGMDAKPSQRGDIQAQELRWWEEAAGRELNQQAEVLAVEEVSPRGAGSHRDLHQCKVSVRGQWGGTATALPVATKGKSRSCPKEEELRDPKLSHQGEGSVSSQENQARSPAHHDQTQTPSEQQEEADEGSLAAEEWSEEETSTEDNEDWKYHTQTEHSQECQAFAEAELSQDDSSSQDLSYWDDFSEPELCNGELSHWGSISLSFSMEDDDSSRDLRHDSSDHVSIFSFGFTPSLQEEDSWDKPSILELCEGEGKTQSLEALMAEGLPVPIPQEAWAPKPVCASLPSLQNQASVAQQEPEAGPQSPRPAPKSPPSPSAPQAPREQPTPPSKERRRLRQVRQAVQALFCWPCLVPPLQK